MIRAILAASRPISWVNTAVPFALAYLLDTGRVDWRLCVGFVFFLVPYNIAMYGINDVFDYESDIRNPRKGGIEGAVLPRSMHRPLLIASAVTVAPFAAVLYAAGTWVSAAWLTLALAAARASDAADIALAFRADGCPEEVSHRRTVYQQRRAMYALVLDTLGALDALEAPGGTVQVAGATAVADALGLKMEFTEK